MQQIKSDGLQQNYPILILFWFDSLRPSQHLLSYVGTGLSRLNQN